MPNNLKIQSPWAQLGLFVFLCGVALVAYSIIAGSILSITGIQDQIKAGTAYDDPRAISVMKLSQSLSSVFLFGIPGFFYALMTFRDQPLLRLGLRPATPGIFYLLAILLLLVSLPLEGWLGDLNKRFPLPQWAHKMEQDNEQLITAYLKVRKPSDIFINLLVVAALPAFFEELFFRGALQRILIRLFGNPWAGIIVTGILFSLFHLEFEGFLPRMFLGILLGAACWYSGSLWTAILAHFFFNGIQVVAAMYYPAFINKNPSTPQMAVLLSLSIVVSLLYWMRKRSAVSYAAVFS